MDFYRRLVFSLFYYYSTLSLFIYSTTPPMNSYALQLCLHLLTFYSSYPPPMHSYRLLASFYHYFFFFTFSSHSTTPLMVSYYASIYCFPFLHLHLPCTPKNFFHCHSSSTQLHLLWTSMLSNHVCNLQPLNSLPPPSMHCYGLLIIIILLCLYLSFQLQLLWPPILANHVYIIIYLSPITFYFFISTSHGLLPMFSFFILSLFFFVCIHLLNYTSYELLCSPTMFAPHNFLFLHLHHPCIPMDYCFLSLFI